MLNNLVVVNRDFLNFQNDRAFSKMRPFTGVSLLLRNGVVQKRECFQDGNLVNQDLLPFDVYTSSILEVEDNLLNYDGDFAFHNGQPFWGVSYRQERDSQVYGSVYQFEYGSLVSSAVTDEGVIKTLTHEGQSDGMSQHYEWDNVGRIKKLELYRQQVNGFGITFKEPGVVHLLEIKSGFNKRKELFSGSVYRDLFLEDDDFLDLVFGEDLALFGEGIDEDILSLINFFEKSSSLKSLRLYYCSIRSETISRLAKLPCLKTLNLNKVNVSQEYLSELSRAVPSVNITLYERGERLFPS